MLEPPARRALFCILSGLVIQLCAMSPTSAQLANLLRDIRPTHDSWQSEPEFLASIGDTTVFTALDPYLDRELWTTNGTPEGTRPFPVACPGDCGSVWTLVGRAGDHLYLIQRPFGPGSFGWNLVAIDEAGEMAFRVGSGGEWGFGPLTDDRAAVTIGSQVFFSTQAQGGQVSLYSVEDDDLTLSLVTELPFHAPGFGFTAVGEDLFFFEYSVTGLPVLWRSDGTAAGTSSIAELPQGEIGESAALDEERLLFLVTRFGGSELWASDGTTSGTRVLTSGSPTTTITQLIAGTDLAYFFLTTPSEGQELWKSDGTPGGTAQVTSFGHDEPFGSIDFQSPLVVVEDRAFFYASDGLTETALWRVSGEPGTAQRVIDVCGPFDCVDQWLSAAGGRTFFLRDDPETGREVWSTDAGTLHPTLLMDVCIGSCFGGGTPIAEDSSRFAYAASSNDGRSVPWIASAPWGPPVSIFDSQRNAPLVSQFLLDLPSGIFQGPRLYFSGLDHFGGSEPWVSHGTPATTFLLADIGGPSDSDSDITAISAITSTVAFVSSGDFPGKRLWLTGGSPESTRAVEPADAPCGHNPRLHSVANAFVYFGCGDQVTAVDPVSNEQLTLAFTGADSVTASESDGNIAVAILQSFSGSAIWKSDGTAAGTAMTLQLPPSATSSFDLWSVNQRFLLSAGDPPRLHALSQSLTSLQPIGPAVYYPDGDLTPKGEPLGFFSVDAVVWRTDGTAAGTYPLVLPGDGHRVHGASRDNDGFDLLLRNVSGSFEIWRYLSGSSASLRAVVPSTVTGSGTLPMARVGDRIFFVTAGSASQLWTIADGSDQVENLEPADLDYFFVGRTAFSQVGERLLFQGCEPIHGCELWSSDGTELGTRMLHDLNPGPASSTPNLLADASAFVLLTADDGLHGSEPWSVSKSEGPDCIATSYSLCLAAGRFQVTASWRDFADRAGDATAVPLTVDTGYFWFFDDQNVEMILKVLDGSGLNGHHWVFYGALTNVEYYVTVADGDTGATKRYFNTETRFASAGDIEAFGPFGANALRSTPLEPTRRSSPPLHSRRTAGIAELGSCAPSATRFCILDGRFAVEAHWEDFEGNTGVAYAGTLTDDTGYLYFFDPENVEIVLKAIDGGGLNNHYWIFYGALSNVEYTITVTDTVAGTSREYRNRLGNFGSFGDIEAFPAD